MSDLVKQVERNISSRRLLEKGQAVLIAVSGGLDSMVLLKLLHHLSEAYQWQLTVAHLNHRLRGRSSDADERLVRAAAGALGLRAKVESANVREYSRRHKLSLEMAARKVRHDFLARVARRLKIKVIAVAHHADDQVEHFFLRLLRGSGSETVAGMKWQGPSPSDSKIKLIRPLLDVPKAALRAYAAENRIHFREDASNACLDIQRNRIRHELLPMLRGEYQPALDKTIPRVMDIIGAEAELVSQIANSWLRRAPSSSPPAEPFDNLPVAVQRRCLQLQLHKLGLDTDFDLIEQLRGTANRRISASQTGPSCPRPSKAPVLMWAVRDATGLVQVQKSTPAGFSTDHRPLAISRQSGDISFKETRIHWRTLAKKGVSGLSASPGQEFFDADRVGSPIVLRHWLPGDRFQPIGMAQPVKLQDLFINEKIPKKQRHQLIVGVAASGEIFWVEGLRISERFKLTEKTIRRLQWLWERH